MTHEAWNGPLGPSTLKIELLKVTTQNDHGSWPWQRPMLLNLGPLHTRDWGPMTSTLQALSLVEKAEPVQVRFTLRLRDQQSMWMQDGCKVYMDSYMSCNGLCFMVIWVIFKNHLLEAVRPNTKQWDHVTLNYYKCWFIMFYHVWGSGMNKK